MTDRMMENSNAVSEKKISAKFAFTQATAKTVVRKFLDDVGILADVEFDLRGLPADETFTISFKENHESAFSHVKKVIDG